MIGVGRAVRLGRRVRARDARRVPVVVVRAVFDADPATGEVRPAPSLAAYRQMRGCLNPVAAVCPPE